MRQMPQDAVRWEELEPGDEVLLTGPWGSAVYKMTKSGMLAIAGITEAEQKDFETALALGPQATIDLDEKTITFNPEPDMH